MTAKTTKRIAPSVYRTDTGHTILAAQDTEGRRSGWHLLDPEGEWMQIFASKTDALNALDAHLLAAEARAVNNPLTTNPT